MSNSKNISGYVATTFSGLEDVLAEELLQLGAVEAKPGNRAVEFRGSKELLYGACLWCRTAIRILKPLRSFRAANREKLYKQAYSIDWPRLFDVSNTFAIDAVVSRSENFNNTLFAAQCVKDAIADHFVKNCGRRPSVDLKQPEIRIHLHMRNNSATLSLDAAGDPLHKRGYRGMTSEAPINETLAAGLLKLANWDGVTPLLDPMCGAGTIPIEAAMIASNTAPGTKRKKYALMNWKDFDSGMLSHLRMRARLEFRPEKISHIFGSDISRKNIENARGNARSADVFEQIRFEPTDFFKRKPPTDRGVMLMNVPFGERMAQEDIEDFYSRIGDCLKTNWAGWDAFIYTGNLHAAKRIGLRPSRRIVIHNGSMECRMLKFELYSGSKT